MKKILVAFLLLSSVFLIVFALLRAVPAAAQSGSAAPGTRPYSYNGLPPNTARNGTNSDDEDEDCMCKDDPSEYHDPSEYPMSVTVDRAGNVVPLATTAAPVSDKPDLVPGLITSPTSFQVAPASSEM